MDKRRNISIFRSPKSFSLRVANDFSVIAGMGIGFGNGEGMKSRNRDLGIKFISFLIEEEKRKYRVCKKRIL